MQKILLFAFLALLNWGHVEGGETEAVKQRTASYISSFNKKDPKEMAQHWAQDASYINPLTGTAVKGRAEIEKQLAELFKGIGDINLKIETTTVDFPSTNKAVQRGKVTFSKVGQPSKESLFQAVFVKQDGQWNISKIDEVEWLEAPTNAEKLKDLEWLIGEWVDKSDTFEVESAYQWDKFKNFITHHFKVTVLGKPDVEGQQIIGWDPVQHEVRSWMFDSDGGFAQGKWKKEGKSWVVETASTLPSGAVGSQVTIFTPVDRNSYTLEITGREINGELLPHLEPVKIVRKGGV